MVGYGIIYGTVLIGLCVFSSARILPPLKVDPSSLHLYKMGLRNELDYMMKRNAAAVQQQQSVDESPDSKERRSQMGSSFIRFGRNRLAGTLENPDYTSNNFNEIDSASRIPRGRSDVIIRFGRAGISPENFDINHEKIRLPIELLRNFAILCPDFRVISSSSSNSNGDLAHFCASLMALESNQSDKSN